MMDKKTVIISNLEKFKNWFIGDFENSFLRTKDFEVAVFKIKKGEKSDGHAHAHIVEINLIVSGEAVIVIDGIKHKLKEGDIFTFPPKVRTFVTYTKDTTLVCVKSPSIPGDKIYIEKDGNDE